MKKTISIGQVLLRLMLAVVLVSKVLLGSVPVVNAATRAQDIQTKVKKAAEEHARQIEVQGFPALQPEPTPSSQVATATPKPARKSSEIKVLNTWWDGRVVLKTVDGLWVLDISFQPQV